LKGNPASKRMGNEAAKRKRARSWAKRQQEKFKNRAEQEKAALLNRVLRSGGEATPWERVKARRRAIRHGAGLVS